MMPNLSIILPIYNEAQGIPELQLINSFSRQFDKIQKFV